MTAGRSARRKRVELPHVDGLDGLRGVAVIAVILYHAGVGPFGGGFLGVEIFFVLSGFLITSLLITEWGESGSIGLPGFWARRARRLLPALLLLVLVIGIYYAAAGPASGVPGLLGDGLAALFYYGNWHQIAAGASYFAATGPTSPFQHTWSLAIEEQFYILWPPIVLGVLIGFRTELRRLGQGLSEAGAVGPRGALLAPVRGLGELIARFPGSRRPRQPLPRLLVVTLVLLAVSVLESATVFGGEGTLDRVYYGTDTRATGLLMGGALAIYLRLLRRRGGRAVLPPWASGPRVSLFSGAALGLLLLLVLIANGTAGWLYPYGLLIVDLLTAFVIAVMILLPRSVAGGVLSWRPLREIGNVSYGLYLWHFPLFLWLNEPDTGLRGLPLFLLRIVMVSAVSIVSYVFVEQPIRQRRWPVLTLRWASPAAVGAAMVSLFVASVASAVPTGLDAVSHLPPPPPDLTGSGAACTVALNDRPGVGLAPVPSGEVSQFVLNSLDSHALSWSGSGQATFHTCPPKRVMVIGDSLAFTLAVPWLDDEQSYGVELANAATLGCSFGVIGDLNVGGVWHSQSPGCPTALSTWAAEERAFGARVVVVELGYRDTFDWLWNGQIVHLGMRRFDAYVLSRIERYVKVLGAGGVKLLFLTVPRVDPPALSDGSPAPAADPVRHRLINELITRAAATDPQNAGVLDLDSTVSPDGQYTATVNGQLCRFDGIHFTTYCAKLLEPRVLGEARGLLSAGAARARVP
jgi:peptidoglycan/LPS O-acetylase OafA/YrhL